MKTIFRSFGMAIMLGSVFALGTTATFAQDPCTDAAGQSALYDKFLEAFKVKTVEGRRAFTEIGKQYVEKYGTCEATKTNVEYFNTNIPKWEATIKTMSAAAETSALTGRFDKALTAKNWDETFATGKQILTKDPEGFRSVEIALAGIGGEEALKGNNKFNDDALRFAKQSIADLEANKSFTVAGKERYGLGAGEFPNKQDALAWLNLYTGYITAIGQKNKQAALPYLYKTTQITSSQASKNAVVYDLIGSYYFDELNKIVEQIQAAAKTQSDTDTPEIAQQKVDNIKKLVAQSNGTAERAMDAYSRAYTFAKDPTIKARLKKNVEDAYKLRFGNTTGVDAWITSAVAKPFVNPTTPIAPISDAEPAKTTSGSTSVPTAPASTPVATPAKATTTTTAPATKPAAKPTATKPGVAMKKSVVKKSA